MTPASDSSLQCDPIFILGTYRSGTTLLRLVLDSHSHIACPPETTFLEHLRLMVDDDQSIRGFTDMGFSREHVIIRARSFASYFYGNYARSWDKARWADKSPEYAGHGEWLLELFPDAQFVSLVRDPLDQIHSHTRNGTYVPGRLEPFLKGDEDPRLGAARFWAEDVRSQLDFERRHSAITYPLRYEDLAMSPAKVLRPLFAFLGEPWEPGVLQFNDYPHDFGRQDDRARTSQGFSISSGGFDRWPQGVRDSCIAIVADTLDELNHRDSAPSADGETQADGTA